MAFCTGDEVMIAPYDGEPDPDNAVGVVIDPPDGVPRMAGKVWVRWPDGAQAPALESNLTAPFDLDAELL